jgi:ribosome-associated toxin RatA of RatAB toxin-antitoxin module
LQTVLSTISIDIAAPAELVFRLARDIERWPRLLPHYVRVTPLDRASDGSLTAAMVARRPFVPVLGIGMPVAWRARTWSEPATLRLRFVHRGGATNGMDVTWRIEPTAGGCRVSIDHDFRPRIAIWATFIDRAFTRPIATRTLATFRAIAESVAAAADPAAESAADGPRDGAPRDGRNADPSATSSAPKGRP